MLPNAETPQHHSGTWGSISTYSLGLSATQIKDLCAAASKNDVRTCSLIVGSRHCSYVYEKLLPPITLLLRKNCVAFILVSSTTAH